MDFLASVDNTTTILVALMVSIIAPSMLAIGTARQARKSKQQDWAHQAELESARITRENEVAKKLADTTAASVARAESVAAAAAEVAAKAHAAAVAASLAAESTSSQLEGLTNTTAVIHGLVNSSLTEARSQELGAVKDALNALRRLLDLDVEKGVEPDPDDLGALHIKESRVKEIEKILADRAIQQQNIDRQITSEKTVEQDPPL